MKKQQSNLSRRLFLSNTAKAGLGLTIGLSAAGSLLQSCSSSKKASGNGVLSTGFSQTKLPYGFSDLHPSIDAMTMEIHYTKHAAGYAQNLQDEAQALNIDMSKPLEDVLARISKYSTKLRNNGGGHYNHELFWQCMTPRSTSTPSGILLQEIESAYGSFAGFKTRFEDAAKSRFGSGWAWLVVDKNKKLAVGSTPNQDNPLMDISDFKGTPILGLDVWEHAYYLKYQNKRPDYIDNWWKVVNWEYVQKRFDAAMAL
ncbi:MAG TPA: superoxide dismutase [Parasegetibacter sp.]